MKNESTEKRIKYIVEVPEPATGQVVSSGGIRGKNGRIQAQFTNPKRYYEDDPSASLGQSASNNQTVGDLLVGNALSATEIIVYTFFKEYVLPVIRNKIQLKASRNIELSRANARSKNSESVSNPLVFLGKQSTVCMDKNDDSVVIPFPYRKIG